VRANVFRPNFIEPKATIQDYRKKSLKNSEHFLIFEKSLKNGSVYRGKLKFFVVLSKFEQNNIFQKFKKNLVKNDLDHQKWRDTLISTHLF
jgi:hypothetical protein